MTHEADIARLERRLSRIRLWQSAFAWMFPVLIVLTLWGAVRGFSTLMIAIVLGFLVAIVGMRLTSVRAQRLENRVRAHHEDVFE